MNYFSVWVGGIEINDYQIETQELAEKLANYWKAQGYDDVQIEEVKNAIQNNQSS